MEVCNQVKGIAGILFEPLVVEPSIESGSSERLPTPSTPSRREKSREGGSRGGSEANTPKANKTGEDYFEDYDEERSYSDEDNYVNK